MSFILGTDTDNVLPFVVIGNDCYAHVFFHDDARSWTNEIEICVVGCRWTDWVQLGTTWARPWPSRLHLDLHDLTARQVYELTLWTTTGLPATPISHLRRTFLDFVILDCLIADSLLSSIFRLQWSSCMCTYFSLCPTHALSAFMEEVPTCCFLLISGA